MKKKRLHITIDPEILKRLNWLSGITKYSRSTIVELVVQNVEHEQLLSYIAKLDYWNKEKENGK